MALLAGKTKPPDRRNATDHLGRRPELLGRTIAEPKASSFNAVDELIWKPIWNIWRAVFRPAEVSPPLETAISPWPRSSHLPIFASSRLGAKPVPVRAPVQHSVGLGPAPRLKLGQRLRSRKNLYSYLPFPRFPPCSRSPRHGRKPSVATRRTIALLRPIRFRRMNPKLVDCRPPQ